MNGKNKKKYNFIFLLWLIITLLLGFAYNDYNFVDQKSRLNSHIIPSATSKNIVAANSIIADAVESVIGEDVDVIVSGSEDPHSYEPTSSEVSALEDADIIFRLGLDHIEPWWETDWEDAIIVELVEEYMIKEDPLLETHTQSISLSEEEEHTNPHVWMDPNNMINFTRQINQTMTAEDSSNAATFSSNSAEYIAMLENLLDDIEDAKNEFKDLKVVVYHPAFFYLFELLDVERIATIEQGEGKEPSAEDIANIIDEMQEEDVHLIIANPQHESDNVYEIARSTDSKIALLTPLLNVEVTWDGEVKEIKNYEDMIKYDLWALANPEDPPDVVWLILLIVGIAVAAIIIVLIIIRRRSGD